MANERMPVMSDAEQRFSRTMYTLVGHCKRSLLDLCDAQDIALKHGIASLSDPKAREILEDYRTMTGLFRKRIHNDVTILMAQAVATFEILEKGGLVPEFGRTEEQLSQARNSGGRR